MNKQKTNKAIIYDKFFIDILCARKLKEIISDKSKFIGQEIFICDKEKVYGTIILNEPHILNRNFFKNHESRHFITNIYMKEIFPDTNKFNAFSFRIKKIFKEPLEYTYEGQEGLAMSEFVEGIEILEKGVIGYRDLGKAPIEESWSGPTERRKADVKVLRIISAWFDSDNSDVKSAYKLPHHKAEGQHAAVFRGVTAAMGALLGARGGVDIPSSDRQGVYNHLKRHYGQFDKEAPTFKSYSVDDLKSTFPELYEDIRKYEEKLELFKNIEVEDEDKELQKLYLELFKLFLKKFSEKSRHPVGGRRPCPPGMIRDRRTGRCVRRN